MTFEVPAHGGKPASRIRQKNEETILKAAEDEFARHGFKGTSMNAIALTDHGKASGKRFALGAVPRHTGDLPRERRPVGAGHLDAEDALVADGLLGHLERFGLRGEDGDRKQGGGEGLGAHGVNPLPTGVPKQDYNRC